MLVGVVVFFVCWIYAVAEFGFFLGLGLGWFPSLVIAWMAMWVVSWTAVLVLGTQDFEKSDKGLPKSSLASLQIKKINRSIIIIPLMLGAILVSALVFLESEFNGACDRERAARERVASIENTFREMGVQDLNELRTAPFGTIVLTYGSEVARKRNLLAPLDGELAMAEFETGFCF